MPAVHGYVLLRVLFFCVYGLGFCRVPVTGVAKNFGGGMIVLSFVLLLWKGACLL